MISNFKSKLVYKYNDNYERLTTFEYNGEYFEIECSFERMLEFIKLLQVDKTDYVIRYKKR